MFGFAGVLTAISVWRGLPGLALCCGGCRLAGSLLDFRGIWISGAVGIREAPWRALSVQVGARTTKEGVAPLLWTASKPIRLASTPVQELLH